MNKELNIRVATKEDVSTILDFIKALADYENLSDQVFATEEGLIDALFNKNEAEVIIGEYMNEPIGFALFFQNFSTFLGKSGLYLEDLYVHHHMRGKGFGKKMLTYLAALSVERGYGRFEWSCLDWNEPSIEFYKSLGAQAMDDWTGYRVTGEALANLAKL